MDKTILLTNNFPAYPLEIVRSLLPAGFRLEMVDAVSQQALLQKAPCADYFLASGRLKINADVLDRAPDLRMIQRLGVGLDSLALEEIRARGVPIYVNQGVNAHSVAEHTLLLILACLRHLTLIDGNVRKGIWASQMQGTQTRTLQGRTVGVIGVGNIGRAVIHMLNAFGARVIYYNRSPLKEPVEAQYVELPQLLRQSDVITLHWALTEETKGMICRETIDQMKDGVILVNTGRGKLICEKDLVEALRSGKVGFAGLDVFEEEPLTHSELTGLNNVILTPHVGGVTYDAFYQMVADAMRNIQRFEEGDLQAIAQYRL